MPRTESDSELMMDRNEAVTENVTEATLPSVAADASLAVWLATPESVQRWWEAAALDAASQRSLGDEWLAEAWEQRVGVAVTAATGRRPDDIEGDDVPGVIEVRTAGEQTQYEVDEPSAVERAGAAAGELDVPRAAEPQRPETGDLEAARGDAASWWHAGAGGDAALDAVWAAPWSRAIAAADATDVEPAEWVREIGPWQEMPDEDVVAAAGEAGDVIIVNVTGIDEAEIADIAVQQYEAARARQRFWAHVSG